MSGRFRGRGDHHQAQGRMMDRSPSPNNQDSERPVKARKLEVVNNEGVLKSHKMDELLDAIDKLRLQGVNHYVALPQLIVCGDQSSGKSSVLEAVSGVRFPTKDELCTRFATELILRRGPENKITASLVPSSNATPQEKERLSKCSFGNLKIDQFAEIVHQATRFMGLDSPQNAKAFSEHVLRIELFGPNQPHLTLVDLPGLIHAETRDHSTQDIQLVARLVNSYMENPRSIIMAVVSAKSDFALQIVTSRAKQFDPRGIRTLGVITKPDALDVGSAMEESYVDLIRNPGTSGFRLGWHALRNRGYATRDSTDAERDEHERAFFSSGIWAHLDAPECLGIATLKPRLANVLREQIMKQMPALINDIQMGIKDCESRLVAAGEPRDTLSAQKFHVWKISEKFSGLMFQAVNGTYLDKFFAETIEESKQDSGKERFLRAVIQSSLISFAKNMRLHGQKYRIMGRAGRPGNADSDDEEEDLNPLGKPRPARINQTQYLTEVQKIMQRHRGREVPGTYNPLVIGELFHDQCEPWQGIMDQAYKDVIQHAEVCLSLVLHHVTDQDAGAQLASAVFIPTMNDIKERMKEKIEEIMRAHNKAHMITYNHYFTDTVRKIRVQRQYGSMLGVIDQFSFARYEAQFPEGDAAVDAVEEPAEDVPPSPDETDLVVTPTASELDKRRAYTHHLLMNMDMNPDMDLVGAEEAVDCMRAYYKTAMKTLIDNFAVLVVENCLMDPLTHILNADKIGTLSDATIEQIAGERADAIRERDRIRAKLASLKAGMQTIQLLQGKSYY